jgi:hypothetical protein
MSKDDIIKLARVAGVRDDGHRFEFSEYKYLEHFAALVAAHKAEIITAEAYRCGYKAGMEAAALVCENVDKSTYPADLAAAIRARSEK